MGSKINLHILAFLMVIVCVNTSCTNTEATDQAQNRLPTNESGPEVQELPAHPNQWTTQKAHEWYDQQPWLVGTNFGPSTAINQLEMWQAATFDPETIHRELALSASIGMNAHRVYLHNLLWEQDSLGLVERMEQFLTLADQHGIKTMFVLFDGVWHPIPKLGKQPDPVPRRHNSGWVQSPGASYLKDQSSYPKLEGYVKGVVRHFANDNRILAWDVFNEPENQNSSHFAEFELADKYDRAFNLLKVAFTWVRTINPSQPITAGVWGAFIGPEGKQTDELTTISTFMLEHSDIITFHNYDAPEVAQRQIAFLKTYNRPILCTEYLARSRKNTFEQLLPLFKTNHVGAFNWGFVSGKTNTIYPWDSWDSVYTAAPSLWHHDIFKSDLTQYRTEETTLIKELTSK